MHITHSSLRHVLAWMTLALSVHVYADEVADSTASVRPSAGTLYKVSFSGAGADGGTPFWMASHTHGRMPTDITGFGGYMQAGVQHTGRLTDRWQWEAAMSLVAATPRIGRHVFVEEAYAALSYRDRLALSIGSRAWDGNASATRPTSPDPTLSSGDLLLSPNARPIPEITLYTPRLMTVPLTGGWLAAGGDFTKEAQRELEELEALGFDKMPVCMAKTQYSLSDDAALLGRPEGFRITVRELRLAAGAGFVVALTGSILTMPGLPKHPAAMDMDITEDGRITGLF